MSIDNLKSSLPEYAKDLKLNLGTLTRSTELSEQQLWERSSPLLLPRVTTPCSPRSLTRLRTTCPMLRLMLRSLLPLSWP